MNRTLPTSSPRWGNSLDLFHITRRFALAAIIAAALSNIYELKLITKSVSATTDRELDDYLKRLDQLRKLLPPAQRVGYVSDLPAAEISANPEQFRKYCLTQYALIPVLVRPWTDENLIVGSFSGPAAAERAMKEFTVIRDLGRGVLLLHKRTE